MGHPGWGGRGIKGEKSGGEGSKRVRISTREEVRETTRKRGGYGRGEGLAEFVRLTSWGQALRLEISVLW